MSRAPIPKRLRWRVLARDHFACCYCGRSPSQHGVALDIDHIKPVSAGGTNDPDNLATACDDCNSGKGDGRFPTLTYLNIPEIWIVWSIDTVARNHREAVSADLVLDLIELGKTLNAADLHNIVCGYESWPEIVAQLETFSDRPFGTVN